ncbi:MAG: SpoIIE family protein phosphatase [Bacteroidales bacterium]|nr:SpoIIE family protein phosphatase [Bacteroidales bacterium]
MRPILVAILLLLISAENEVDSILSLIKPNTPKSEKAVYYSMVGEMSDNTDTVIKYASLSLSNCSKNDVDLIADNYSYIAWAYYLKNKTREALTYNKKAAEYYKKSSHIEQCALKYVNIAKCYHQLHLSDSAFCYFSNAMDIFESLGDTLDVSYVCQSIGNMYYDMGLNKSAQEYYTKALNLDSLSCNYVGMAEDYQTLGFAQENNPKLEIYYLKKAAMIFDTITTDYCDDSKFDTYHYLASAYIKMAKKTGYRAYADTGFNYLQQVVRRELDMGEYNNYVRSQLVSIDYLEYCQLYDEALKVLNQCRPYLHDDSGDKDLLALFYEYDYLAREQLGDYKGALEANNKMHQFKMARVSDSALNVIADFKTSQAMKVSEAEKRELKASKSRMRILIFALIGGLLLGSLLVFYIVRMLNIKRKSNRELAEKNSRLDQQKSEILAQRDEITAQRDQIEDINRKVFSSINYAQKIQSAAVSKKADVDALFPENFIYYRPRDIVSGDFYRATQCGKYHVMITADCTGHGIPGAFLSMLGLSALKEFCVTEQDAENPGTILDRMRNFIKSTLVSSDSERKMSDGMDMTICCYDFDAMQMRYACANHTAYLIRNGEVITLKGDRMPVGRYLKEKDHFTSYTQAIEKGDVVYTLSDGIQDQPGGPENDSLGKKFLAKNLLAFLLDNYTKPMSEQCELLDNCITEWRNGRPQVDDMTLIGVRV